jgi:hypothetical protein
VNQFNLTPYWWEIARTNWQCPQITNGGDWQLTWLLKANGIPAEVIQVYPYGSWTDITIWFGQGFGASMSMLAVIVCIMMVRRGLRVGVSSD